MIALADVITRFEGDYLRQYPHALTSQRQALAAMKSCRTAMAPSTPLLRSAVRMRLGNGLHLQPE